MKQTLLLALMLISSGHYLLAQDEKRANVWYFGNKNGIDFNTNPPIPLQDGALFSSEGCTSISDTGGRLLFYSNGETIWNRRHEVMEGGADLGGNQTVTQAGIIIQSIAIPTQYYLFYINHYESESSFDGTGDFYYALIDMTENNGLGKVISSRNSLRTHCTEKLTAVRHCNGKDFWIITHERLSNKFMVWLLSETGISTNPIISTVGLPHLIPWGYMKGSPLGDKLVLGNYREMAVEVFDFDKEKGIISNPIAFQGEMYGTCYGVAFSPNGKRLYITNVNDQYLLQVNLDLPTTQEIQSSVKVIANTVGSAIQNAPNGKLYVNTQSGSALSVIHAPNELGLACDFREDDFELGKRLSGGGLPNFPSIYFRERDTIEAIELSETCEGLKELTAITNVGGDSVVYQWYYENELIPDAATTKLQATLNGLYEFKALVYTNCKTVLKEYTKNIDAEFEDVLPLTIERIDKTDAFCDETNGIISIEGSGGVGLLEYKIDEEDFQEFATFSDLSAKNYTITIKDERACELEEEVFIEQYSKPRFVTIQTQPTRCGEATGSLSLEGIGRFGNLSAALDKLMPITEMKANNLRSGAYLLELVDESGCTIDTTISIASLDCPFFIPNTFSPNGDGLNDFFEVNTHPEFEGEFKELKIYDRWGSLIYENSRNTNAQYKWDGEFQGKQMPIGAYLYQLRFNHLGKGEEVITGVINLVY